MPRAAGARTTGSCLRGDTHGVSAMLHAHGGLCETLLLSCSESVLLACSNSPSWPSQLRCRASVITHSADEQYLANTNPKQNHVYPPALPCSQCSRLFSVARIIAKPCRFRLGPHATLDSLHSCAQAATQGPILQMKQQARAGEQARRARSEQPYAFSKASARARLRERSQAPRRSISSEWLEIPQRTNNEPGAHFKSCNTL